MRGKARLGKRTKDLVKRLGPGDVAIIDHRDLDRMAAEDLVECGVRGVVNVAPSTSSRYPNPGPLILVRAGVHLVDAVGSSLFEDLSDGDMVIVSGGTVLGPRASWRRVRCERSTSSSRSSASQQERIGQAIEDFAENTLTHIRDEREVLVGKLKIPDLRTNFRDRHALIVVRGTDYRRDLRAIRPYVRDLRPCSWASTAGRAARERAQAEPDHRRHGLRFGQGPAMRRGAGRPRYRDGVAPGRERLERLGLEHKVLPAAGTSQDVAMLLAYERGARLIVSVGSHFNLIEFLDKDRAGMSSTFLTRLRVGEILVDTKGVSRLYPQGPSRRLMMLIVLAAFVTLVIVVLSSPPMERLLELVWLKIQVLFEGT